MSSSWARLGRWVETGDRLRFNGGTIRGPSPFDKWGVSPLTDPRRRKARTSMSAQSAPTQPNTEPPRAQRADAKRNVELLLEAARVAIARDGPDASLDDIARD